MGLECAIAAISRWMARAGGCALLAAALLVGAEVVLRYSGAGGFSLGTELSSYALSVGASWALAHVVFEKAHVRVDVLSQRLPAPARGLLDVTAMASLFAVGCMLSYGAVDTALTSMRFGAAANTTLGTPLVLPQAAWAFGLAWFAFVAGYRTVCAGAALVGGRLAETFRIAAPPGTADEVEHAIAETQSRLGTGG